MAEISWHSNARMITRITFVRRSLAGENPAYYAPALQGNKVNGRQTIACILTCPPPLVLILTLQIDVHEYSRDKYKSGLTYEQEFVGQAFFCRVLTPI